MSGGESKTGLPVVQRVRGGACLVVMVILTATGCAVDGDSRSMPTSSSAPTTQPPTTLRVPKASPEELTQILDDFPLPPSFRFLSERIYQFGIGLAGAKGNAVTRFYETGMSQAEEQAAVYEMLDANGLLIDSRAPAGSVDQFISTQLRGIPVTIETGRSPLGVTATEPT